MMLNKREFLQLTGAGLALPWLELLQPAFGGERRGDTNVKAARCVFIHIPFGVNMWRWFPKEFGPGVDLGATLARGDAADHLGAVFAALLAVKQAGLASNALADHTGVFVDKNAHDRVVIRNAVKCEGEQPCGMTRRRDGECGTRP